MAKLKVNEGGCWFCAQDDENEPLLIEPEFDTFVHESCIQRALKYGSREAEIMRPSN